MINLHETGTAPVLSDVEIGAASTNLTTNEIKPQTRNRHLATIAFLVSAMTTAGHCTEKTPDGIRYLTDVRIFDGADSNLNAQVFSTYSGHLEKEWAAILGLTTAYPADTDKSNPLTHAAIKFVEDNMDAGVTLIHRWIFTTDLGRDSGERELASMIIAELGNLGMSLKSPIHQSARSLISNALVHPVASLREAAVIGVDRLCDPSLYPKVELAERQENQGYIRRDMQQLMATLKSFGA
jgi:hypothetical protein